MYVPAAIDSESPQDDVRQEQMRDRFNLDRPAVWSRIGVDAELDIDGRRIPFELKSTTKGSVSTVRDLSPRHISAWHGKHWLIGFYDRTGRHFQYAVYGSPSAMEPWIRTMEVYIAPDLKMAECVPSLIQLDTLHQVLGDKTTYSFEDAKRLLKVQPKLLASLLAEFNISAGPKESLTSRYRMLMDLADGYSAGRMLEILRKRCQYLLRRGATLNNPSIPAAYFSGWPQLTRAEQLSALVRENIQKASATDTAS
jgi:hypothetical protein